MIASRRVQVHPRALADKEPEQRRDESPQLSQRDRIDDGIGDVARRAVSRRPDQRQIVEDLGVRHRLIGVRSVEYIWPGRRVVDRSDRIQTNLTRRRGSPRRDLPRHFIVEVFVGRVID